MSWLDSTIAIAISMRVGWTLIHSIWMIALVAIGFVVADRLLANSKPNSRYVAGCAALLSMFLLPVIWFCAVEPPVSLIVENGATAVATKTVDPSNRGQFFKANGRYLPRDSNSAIAERQHFGLETLEAYRDGLTDSSQTLENTATANSVFAWISVWVAFVWVLGFCLFCLRPLSGFWRARIARIQRQSDLPERVVAMVNSLSRKMDIGRCVEVAQSHFIQIPSVVGAFRPLILLPASVLTGLTTHELEAVIAHELAHVRRHDYLTNLTQTAIETLLFYHPAVWWVSKQVRIERENCCDDMAVEFCRDRKTYAKALLAISRLPTSPQLGLAANGGVLADRIERIVQPKKKVTPQSNWIIALLIGSAIAIPVGVFLNAGPVPTVRNNLHALPIEPTNNKHSIPMPESGASMNENLTEDEKAFWASIQNGDAETSKRLLAKDKTLAGKNFHEWSEQTEGFPLYHASQQGKLELVRLLLEAGADPDAKLPGVENPRELGMPLVRAVDTNNWEMIHLLLDAGATVHAHPYCDVPFVSRLYYKAIDAGAPPIMALKGFPDVDQALLAKIPPVANDAPEVIKVWDRVLSLGGAPNHFAIINAKDHETVAWLLRSRPTDATTDHWGGNVHEACLYGAAWHGDAKTVELCLDICSDRHTTYAAAHCIRNAITSHNRLGTFEDYRRIIELNLDYLKEQDAFYEHDFLLPLHQLACSFVGDYFYGPLGERPTVEHQLILAKLFVDKGFDVNLIPKDYDASALGLAIAFGHDEYADYLRANGATEPDKEKLSKLIDDTFWNWVERGHELAVARAVQRDPSLAGKNFQPDSELSNGFPLVEAAKKGNLEMVQSLLDAGADPDALLDVEKPLEIGMPIVYAFDKGSYDVVNLLLDHGATVDALPNCDACLVDRVYRVAGAEQDFAEVVNAAIRYSFNDYLASDEEKEQNSLGECPDDAPDSVRLLYRLVQKGGQPSLEEVVRQENTELLKDLLETCPEKAGTKFDFPNGTVFLNICNAGSWLGYPDTLKLCMDSCPKIYNSSMAKLAIARAIRSHNRDGEFEAYRQLIQSQLEYLNENGDLDSIAAEGSTFLPLHSLAKHFVKRNNYGYKCETLTSEEDLKNLVKLFLEYGFDINAQNPKSKLTALEVAKKNDRLESVDTFLVENGAKDLVDQRKNQWQLSGWQHAIENEDMAAVSKLLKQDSSLGLQCLQKFRKDGTWYLMDPLCEAARRDNIQLAKLILDTNRNPNYTYGQGQWNGEVHGAQCLAWAASNEMGKFLIERGADPKTIEGIKVAYLDESPVPYEKTTNDLGLQWQLAIEAGDVDQVRKLLAAHPHLSRQVTMDRWRDGRMGHRSRNPLWISAQAGNLSIVKMIIEAGYDKPLVDVVELASPEVAAFLIDELGVESKPNVGLMAYVGHTESLKFWLDRGHPVEDRMLLDACGNRGRFRGHKHDSHGGWPVKFRETVRVLIDAGANVNGRMPSGNKKYEGCKPWRMNGETPLHFSAGNWDPVQIQMLLDAGADKTLTNDLGETPYDWAVKFDAPEEVKKLLLIDGNSNRPATREKKTSDVLEPDHPFVVAVREVDLPKVKALVAKDKSLVDAQVRSDIYLTGKVWKDGKHVDIAEDASERAGALHFAAFHSHCELAQLLIDLGADIGMPADFGEERDSSPVGIAAWNGDTATLKVLLVAAKAAKIKMDLNSGLHSALAHGHFEKANLLLEYGAEHDICTASQAGDLEALQRLIDESPESLERDDWEYGHTPLEQALVVGQLKSAELLAANGANVSPKAAAAMGRMDELKPLLARDKGAATRLFGEYPLLSWAIFCEQVEVVEFLLENGADPNGVDVWDMSPLRYSAQAKGESGAAIVDLLVAAGADVNRVSRGRTPLANARALENSHIVEALVRHGAKG